MDKHHSVWIHRIDKYLWYIHTKEYYSAMRKKYYNMDKAHYLNKRQNTEMSGYYIISITKF